MKIIFAPSLPLSPNDEFFRIKAGITSLSHVVLPAENKKITPTCANGCH